MQEHIPDLAFQKFVCEKAGLKIEKCFVIFSNKEFVKDGEINSKELSTETDYFLKKPISLPVRRLYFPCFNFPSVILPMFVLQSSPTLYPRWLKILFTILFLPTRTLISTLFLPITFILPRTKPS